jgi:hypothetical protein
LKIQSALRRTTFVALACLATAGGAAAAREPTPAEARAFAAALRAHAGKHVSVRSALVSTVDRAFADVRWASTFAPNAEWVEVYRRAPEGWRFVWGRRATRPGTGACAFVPAPVVRDLYGVACPGRRALHARRADSAERGLLSAAFMSSPLARTYAYRTRLRSLCVSRLNPEWAAGRTVLRETAGVVWFRRSERWHVVYETLGELGALPPSLIVLSLAACTGYNAAQFTR